MKLKNFFFDLDGTIINSEPGLLRAHRHCLEELHYSEGLQILAREGVGWTIGPPLGLTVPRLLGSQDREQIKQYIANFQNAYQQIYYRDFILYDGIDELLRKLYQQGKKLFVCTSKPQPIARKLLEYLHYDKLFRGLIGAHLDERPHEKSDLLRELCQRHSCQAAQSAMIGDRSYDMRAGQQLNFAARIGVTYGFGSEAELRSNGASHIVQHPREIFATF